MLDFTRLFTLISLVFGALALSLLVVPSLIHWLFQISSDPATDIMSRRAGVLFAGLCALVWQARLADDSPLRSAVCLSLVIVLGGLACLGLVEFARGAVGIGIWMAIVVEVFFVLSLAKFWRGTA